MKKGKGKGKDIVGDKLKDLEKKVSSLESKVGILSRKLLYIMTSRCPAACLRQKRG